MCLSPWAFCRNRAWPRRKIELLKFPFSRVQWKPRGVLSVYPRPLSVRRPLSRRNNFRSLSAISLRVVGLSVACSDTRPSYLSTRLLSSLYSALSPPTIPVSLPLQSKSNEKKRANLLLSQHLIYTGMAKRGSPDLVISITALAYHHFCLALPAAFTQPGDHL